MRFRRPLATLAAVTATAAAALGAAAPAQAGVTACSSSTAASVPSSATVGQVERTVLCLVNRERTRRGLRTLKSDGKLAKAAEKHSSDMVDRRYFDHVSPGGGTMQDRIKAAGWFNGARSFAFAENIAWGTGHLSSPKSIVEGWMNSAGHRANILNGRYTQLGVGVALGTPRERDGATYTTNFGAKG
jgi:uncharacterized protein YkwD